MNAGIFGLESASTIKRDYLGLSCGVATNSRDVFYPNLLPLNINNNDANGIMNIGSNTINLNGNVNINNTPLSTSQLINIINGGNLYLWSNFR